MAPLAPVTICSTNPHLLSIGDRPFLLLSDTAWNLLHRLDLESAKEYMRVRASQGFNMIWITGLGEFDGVRVPNCQGDLPLVDQDPLRLGGPFWEYARAVIEFAGDQGLYVGFLPTWGDKLTCPWGIGPLLFPEGSEEVCRGFGTAVAQRFQGLTNIVWVLGGDRPARLDPGSWNQQHAIEAGLTGTEDWTSRWTAMAEGIRSVDSVSLITYHPQGGSESTSCFLNGASWLQMHAMQSGHGGGRDSEVWDMIHRDRALEPKRPTLDAEVNYEDHPVSPWPVWDPALGHFDDYDIRRQIYRSVFAGGCGVVYGHHSVWQFAEDPSKWLLHCKMGWREAVQRPGAWQVRHLATLLVENDYFELCPQPDWMVDNPTDRGRHCEALASGRRLLVYIPVGFPLQLSIDIARANWFDPRTGCRRDAERSGTRWLPPNDIDWVLEGYL
ncbi:MAG: DUF4038 domain-containing protein [Fimbriimonas sp.]|nr:DUF4038 domain-containing protein [Fimbriimonas sp.]